MQSNPITALWRQATLVCTLMLAMVATAQAAPSPDDVIREAVERMTQRIDADRERLKSEPSYARRVVNEELDDLVDFRRITRLVMGDHFQNASGEQRRRFMERFRSSLVQTYAAGVTMYEGQPIRVLPLQDGDVRDNRARVQMEFGTESGRPMPIAYTLFLDGEQWKVDNVIVNGLNLGRVYRMQFDQAVRQHQGDIDKVIAGWTVELDPDEINTTSN
ncbi:MlaC/ttg2D family ABC transporter substrate-binding protein [Isoalcanivorax indicus]|uniref:MlaC/ttg2D family ABC transporter substrate-binding protein n=1 Tax=Isoalcanivorax indicus TaxID=2202653 RepID=UPI001FE5FD56|nr:ABC transporter substrate-binding protein [Isoalcanivorax indicus]